MAALLVMGFPIALVLSWAYDLTPDGMEKTRSVPLSGSIASVTGRKLDFAIIGLMAVGIAFLVIDNYVFVEVSEPELGVDSSETPPGSVAEMIRVVLPNSVAVLPFENLSLDPENAFFAAGIHEEVLNQLFKLRNLSVISRTTMLRYDDSDLSLPEIGRELNVETVMEGSVRYSDDRVRVAAQLIDVRTDEHLWSDVYERELADIFGIQSDIAMNIANALEAEFSIEEQESIEKIPTGFSEAYVWYLRALARTGNWLTDVTRALEIDPDFAEAHALKAFIHSNSVSFSVDADTEGEERLALEHAQRALDLDPALALTQLALGQVHEVYWRWAEARKAFERAYELSPNDADVVTSYGRLMRNIGNYPEAIRAGKRAVELDPLNLNAGNQLAVTYRFARDNDAAAELYRRLTALAAVPSQYHTSLGVVEATRGNAEEAIMNLRRAEELWGGNIDQIFRYAHMIIGYGLAGAREDAERLMAALEERSRESPVGESVWAIAYVALGDYDEVQRRIEAAMAEPSSASYVSLIELKANPWADPVLEEPRFKEVLASLWSE